ncbi:hypothetical protein AXE80_10900 [Wenyingzhuangia fucanilytica]|uniref:Uncharacterized protein n=1 Tax=Wenyingzhuangia fucanilytica TaxID=1790137 RepID=A0A1B1Y7J8_9FLAO|nr:hypothetical protein [Wenyingzhuangia fucanilytica]ANW96752.1 hypothetical protein AXE80_10900 [Wenyingzhuangia fucanilytica]
MIDIISAPKPQELFQNTAPLPIEIRSTLGADHYFVATILVDSVEYDVQTVSKLDDYNATIDLQNVIESIFIQDYIPVSSSTEIVELPNLIKQVNIIIKEYIRSSNTLVNTLELDPFKVINSEQLQNINLDNSQFLSIYDKYIKVPVDGVLMLPFFAKTACTLKLVKNDIVIFSQTLIDIYSIYALNINLKALEIIESDNVYVELNSTNQSYHKSLDFTNQTGYTPSKLVVKNNFNAWEYFYTFGNPKDTGDLDHKTLKLSDSGQLLKYRVNSTPKYLLNSGHYHTSYSSVINNVLSALDVLYYKNNEAINVVIQNKKRTEVKERNHYYFTEFLLDDNHVVVVNNSNQFRVAPSLVNINVSGLENEALEITKAEILAAYNGTGAISITFPVLHNKGTINVHQTSGVSEVSNSTTYLLADFEKIVLTGIGFGDPYTILKFNIQNTEGLSNTASIYFKIVDNNPSSLPPSISMADEVDVYVDANSKTITAVITDTEGDGFSMIWTQNSGQPITMSNTTTSTLLLTNWTGAGEYEFLLTVTDVRNKTSTKTVKLTVMEYKINVAANKGGLSVYGGQPGETAKFKVEFGYDAILIGDISSTGESETRRILFNGVEIGRVKYTMGEGSPILIKTNGTLVFEIEDTFDSDGKITKSLYNDGIETSKPDVKFILTGIISVESATGSDTVWGNQPSMYFKFLYNTTAF